MENTLTCYDCALQEKCKKFKEFEQSHPLLGPCEELPETCEEFQEARYYITDFGRFTLALSYTKIINDNDAFVNNNRLKDCFNVFIKRMTDNGFYYEEGQEKKEINENVKPYDLFKKTLKGFGYVANDDNYEAAWDSFIMMIENKEQNES